MNCTIILQKVAALKVKIFDEGVGIEEDPEEDVDESENEDDSDTDEDEQEGINLNDDNPFSFIEEIKLSKDEKDNETCNPQFAKIAD